MEFEELIKSLSWGPDETEKDLDNLAAYLDRKPAIVNVTMSTKKMVIQTNQPAPMAMAALARAMAKLCIVDMNEMSLPMAGRAEYIRNILELFVGFLEDMENGDDLAGTVQTLS